MDRYEYNLKQDQMKSLMAKGDYHAAAAIADTINWRKIKNVTALVRAGEIYEQVERYEESREILLMAYDRSPIGRTIIYRLASVAVKMKNFEEAQDFYREFIEIAPRDNLKYVLRYEIDKAKEADVKTLIADLEELKEQEFSEKWGYELAYLYHQAGMCDQCIESCDELVLYFGRGSYVEKALELKMLYQPLTKEQEETYRRLHQEQSGVMDIDPADVLVSGEIVTEPKQIKEVQMSPERFNTINLQEALQESMQQIMDSAEEKKEALVEQKEPEEEIPYLQMHAEKQWEEECQLIAQQAKEMVSQTQFPDLLNEEYDGQMRMLVPDGGVYEPQVEGQMTIEDVLAEWEKTRKTATTVLQEAGQREPETAKAKALQEAGDIMERLVDVIPKLEPELPPQEFIRKPYFSGAEEEEEAVKMVANMNQLLQKEIERLSSENAQIDEQLAVAQESSAAQEPEMFVTEEAVLEEPLMEEPVTEESIVEEPLMEEPTMKELQEIFEAAETRMHTETAEELLPKIDLPTDINLEVAITELSEEQKALFTYFTPIKGMEEQICAALSGTASCLKNGVNAKSGNLIIQGEAGSGKTVFATTFIKALQEMTGKPDGRVGKIAADSLNKKDVAGLFQKISGGCLIVERAGNLTQETAEKLNLAMEADTQGTFVVLEDTRHGVEQALLRSRALSAKFTERINIPIFTNDELVVFARIYAKENGYRIDEMGVLALYNSISSIEKVEKATSIAEVKEIVDDAIAHAERGALKKAFSILASSRFDKDDYVILHEKDFHI